MQLRVSEAAALSVIDQADYYRQASDSSLADRWEKAVDQAMRALLLQPERGTSCRFREMTLREMRWIPIPGFPRHMIFYRYLPAEQAVVIVHVLHGARDWESILQADDQ
jgi:plasmid stabilization system protein ParE